MPCNKSLAGPALRKCEDYCHSHHFEEKKWLVSVLYSTAVTMPVSWLLIAPKESTRYDSKLITRSNTAIIPVHVKCYLGPTVNDFRERLTQKLSHNAMPT